MVLTKPGRKRLEWWLVFIAGLAPLSWIIWATVTQTIGADPAKAIIWETGTWSINFLWASLAITPMRQAWSFNWPGRYRRMWGLYGAFYALLHGLAFATFLLGWRLDLLGKELVERPYIVVGFIAVLLLLPLAITSTKGWQKRLGRRWRSLHKLVYPIGLLVLLHIVWQIRSDFFDALLYGSILAWLLGYRLYRWHLQRAKSRA